MSYGTWFPAYGQQGGGCAPGWPGQMHGYPQMQQTAPAPAQAQQQGFFVRPVTNREEAVAAQIDFFGPGTFMPDLANGRVYFKRLNQTGSCDFMTFALERPEQTQTQPQPTEYATKADLVEMQQVIEGLADEISTLRGRGGKRVAEE